MVHVLASDLHMDDVFGRENGVSRCRWFHPPPEVLSSGTGLLVGIRTVNMATRLALLSGNNWSVKSQKPKLKAT